MLVKTTLKTLALGAALSIGSTLPLAADTSVQELFAMSNNSAAETIVRESSMGDLSAARISLALGNMSAAERMAFFEMDQTARVDLIKKKKLFGDGNSAAEMASVIKKAMEEN